MNNLHFFLDVDGNGEVTANDGALILQRVLMAETWFPRESK